MTCVAQLLASGGQESRRGLVTWAGAAAPERVQEKQGGMAALPCTCLWGLEGVQKPCLC